MTQEINLEEIKCKLIERLLPSGWSTKLRGFMQSSDFDQILETLYLQRMEGKRFTPPLKDVFRAFEEAQWHLCNYLREPVVEYLDFDCDCGEPL